METPVYLFAYFVDDGSQGMRLATSRDGLVWKDLANRFFIAPDTDLMRDPFLLQGPDGTFHLIWTTNWESCDIGYASSTNLVDWSPQSRLPVMAKLAGTRNCWAPEMSYDSDKKQFLIYWASTVAGQFEDAASTSESDYNHRMWAATTADFKSVSEPYLFFDPGFNVIDITFTTDSEGRIKLIGKDERLKPEKKNLFVCEAESLYGPFSKPSPAFTESWVEGPAALKVEDWTYVYYDVYREKRYEGKRTQDFKTWEDISDRIEFPQGSRHGSILTLTADAFEKIERSL